MSSPPDPNPDPNPDEEEIARLAALAALNESNSLIPAFPSTMQFQGEVFVLRHNFIAEADATEFYEQAQRYPSMKLTDCMENQAIELHNFRIMIDPEFNIIDPRLRHEWQTKLTVLQAAKLIVKYFSPNGLGECTLAESFSQVPFYCQIANHDHENTTFIRYNELVSNYEKSKGPLSETQHAELILKLEKRQDKSSQIQHDNLKAKAVLTDNGAPTLCLDDFFSGEKITCKPSPCQSNNAGLVTALKNVQLVMQVCFSDIFAKALKSLDDKLEGANRPIELVASDFLKHSLQHSLKQFFREVSLVRGQDVQAGLSFITPEL